MMLSTGLALVRDVRAAVDRVVLGVIAFIPVVTVALAMVSLRMAVMDMVVVTR